MAFHHRMQVETFRTHETPLSGSFWSSLFKKRYQHLNVGDLFDYVMDKLWVLTGVRTNRVAFTLVNVCSPFTKMSFGRCSEPPEAVWPTGRSLILTFAISSMQDYDLDPQYRTRITELNAQPHDNQTTKWSPVRGQADFVSVSVDLTLANTLTLRQPKVNELEYIYNLIGAMSKNVMRHQPQYRVVGQTFDDDHEQRNLQDLHDQIFALPINVLFRRFPYHLWVFNREMWARAPNAIPQRLISPSVALYYFMYLQDHVSINAQTVQDVGIRRLGLLPGQTDGVLSHVRSSVLALGQLVKSQVFEELDRTDLIAPCILSSMAKRMDTRIETNATLQAAHARFFAERMAELQVPIADILYPADKVAWSLFTADRAYAVAVLTLLGLT